MDRLTCDTRPGGDLIHVCGPCARDAVAASFVAGAAWGLPGPPTRPRHTPPAPPYTGRATLTASAWGGR